LTAIEREKTAALVVLSFVRWFEGVLSAWTCSVLVCGSYHGYSWILCFYVILVLSVDHPVILVFRLLYCLVTYVHEFIAHVTGNLVIGVVFGSNLCSFLTIQGSSSFVTHVPWGKGFFYTPRQR
jgi:hypothetical protein